jgi:hypothetical protein
MNIGVGAKLINKAVGKELIPDPSLMLAEDYHKAIDKWNSIVCEEKYDGVRVICVIEDRIPKFYTRAFNELNSKFLTKIANQLLIISKGIDASRISGKGMGELEPKVDCGANCTEEQHAQNRRTEIKILQMN